MARSVSTIPKTSIKPASAPAPAKSDNAPQKEKKTKGAKKDKTVEAVPENVAELPVAETPQPAKSKPRKPKNALPVEAPVDNAQPDPVESVEGVAEEVVSLDAIINGAIQTIRRVEADAKALRARCKSMIYASKKECNSSRKFINSKKKAALAEGQEVGLSPFQALDASVRGLSRQMSTDMVAVKNTIGKCASIHNDTVKKVRKIKKENRNRAPPMAALKPVKVHEKLATFMGVSPDTRLSRHEVFAAIRKHISDNNCYFEGKGKKFINPDAKLAPLFSEVPADKSGEITHFKMQTYLKDYFIKDTAK